MKKQPATKYILSVLQIIIICLSAVPCYAQDNKHPIDRWFESCLAKDNSTAGMRECSSVAYDKWDKELNKNYRDLMKSLPADAKAVLKTAQLQWIKFKDAEFKLIDVTEGRNEGTMWLTVTDGHRLDFVRKRALELKGYLESKE